MVESRDFPAAATPQAAAGVRHHLLALLCAVAGGALGILGAAVLELRSGGFLLLPFVGAPIIEEAVKPLGLYLVLVAWPVVLRSQLYTGLLAALSGLAFGLVEAAAYVTIYVSDPPGWFVAYRFSLPLVMHTTASFIYGLGINRGLVDWAQGRGSFPRRTRHLYIAAVLLHAVFNTAGGILVLAGIGDVE